MFGQVPEYNPPWAVAGRISHQREAGAEDLEATEDAEFAETPRTSPSPQFLNVTGCSTALQSVRPARSPLGPTGLL
jgi:hypothetical protein